MWEAWRQSLTAVRLDRRIRLENLTVEAERMSTVVVCRYYFRQWQTYRLNQITQRRKDANQGQMRNKVASWLTDFRSKNRLGSNGGEVGAGAEGGGVTEPLISREPSFLRTAQNRPSFQLQLSSSSLALSSDPTAISGEPGEALSLASRSRLTLSEEEAKTSNTSVAQSLSQSYLPALSPINSALMTSSSGDPVNGQDQRRRSTRVNHTDEVRPGSAFAQHDHEHDIVTNRSYSFLKDFS